MTKDDHIVSFNYSVLQYAQKHKNIPHACREFNLSRTVHYKRLKRFSKLDYPDYKIMRKLTPRCLIR